MKQHKDDWAREELCKAMYIANLAHTGQYRRGGLVPYIRHVEDVANRLNHLAEPFQSVAYLHDVLEDTPWTADDLRSEGISEPVVVAVIALTKTEGCDYDKYLIGIKGNHLARQVKIADMQSNLSDNPTNKQIEKYSKGLAFLIN